MTHLLAMVVKLLLGTFDLALEILLVYLLYLLGTMIVMEFLTEVFLTSLLMELATLLKPVMRLDLVPVVLFVLTA